MDLNEALRRIFYAHRRSIVFFVALGVGFGVALASTSAPTYTASARVTIGDRAADENGDPVSMADAAEALATSRSVLTTATRAAGLQGDRFVLEPGLVSVKTLGSSEFLQLEVTAPTAVTASLLANALAEEVVQRWAEVSGGQGGEAVALVQETLDGVLERTASLDEQITLLSLKMDQLGGQGDLARLQAQRDSLVAEREALDRQRVSYEAQLSALLVDAASRSAPQVIDPAVPPPTADSRHTVPTAVLGGLLGFLLGAGLAGLIEAVSPTLVGAAAIGDALGVPVLGSLSRPSDQHTDGARRAIVNTRLAASRVRASTLELLPLGSSIDLTALSAAVEGDEEPSDSNRGVSKRTRGQLVAHTFGLDAMDLPTSSRMPASATTVLVAVAPSVLKRSRLREVFDIRAVTAWEIIGVVVYEQAEKRSILRRRPRSRRAPARDLDLAPRAS